IWASACVAGRPIFGRLLGPVGSMTSFIRSSAIWRLIGSARFGDDGSNDNPASWTAASTVLKAFGPKPRSAASSSAGHVAQSSSVNTPAMFSTFTADFGIFGRSVMSASVLSSGDIAGITPIMRQDHRSMLLVSCVHPRPDSCGSGSSRYRAAAGAHAILGRHNLLGLQRYPLYGNPHGGTEPCPPRSSTSLNLAQSSTTAPWVPPSSTSN